MRPVAEGLFELDGDGSITLVGGFSHISGHHHFPLGPVCPYTGADDVEQVLLPRDGLAFQGLTVSKDGIGLRVVTRLTESDPSRLHQGQRMTLVTDDLGDHVATWAFAPVPE